MISTRRTFLQKLAVGAGTACLVHSPVLANQSVADRLYVACNQYTWDTFYRRAGKDWAANLDASLADFAQSGIKGYEPSVTSADQIKTLAPLLKKYGLDMRSIYVNTTLHKNDEADKTIQSVNTIADAAKPLGVKIIVTNPSPLRWGTPEDKSDADLTTQAQNLNRLGAELRKRGITLAYHTHDMEMRNSAREFHHMMLGTDPSNVSLCLDVHWIYRGSGNSQVALFDIVKLYGKRITELHLRQSKGGVWTETFGKGDIDYQRLVKELQTIGVRPMLVLEQCLEKQSPNTTDVVTAHRDGLAYVKTVFNVFAGY